MKISENFEKKQIKLFSLNFDKKLIRHIQELKSPDKRIKRAMIYFAKTGGKRIRPFLLCRMGLYLNIRPKILDDFALSIECVHLHSLIHDDLPSMDDDDLRRGRPTSHKVFGEAVAILSGDALLTLAFEILAQSSPTRRYSVSDAIQELARASGSIGMIAGQVADMEAEGSQQISVKQLQYIHASKTAALLSCSLRLGAMSANATPARLQSLSEFGRHVGLAFQVVDDILDVTQSSDRLGKTAGKDQAAAKATYPALMGLSRSRRQAARLTQKAFDAIKPFGAKAKALHAMADFLLHRDY